MTVTIPKLKKEHWFHPDGFPLAIERRDPQEPFGLHSHEFSELVIITRGSGVSYHRKRFLDARAGRCFCHQWIPPA